jgi:dTMP kinase
MFVSFEGVDGSGKSTQARLLAEHLREAGREVVLTREPGGTPLGESIRELLLAGDAMAPWSEAALFAAARSELVAEVIGPARDRGAWIVCDRFVDSSLAYQGIARGLGVDEVLHLNLPGLAGRLPDRTFVLLLDAGSAAARLGALDRIEREGDAFRARVNDAYAELAQRFPERIATLDGAQSVDALAERIRAELEAYV